MFISLNVWHVKQKMYMLSLQFRLPTDHTHINLNLSRQEEEEKKHVQLNLLNSKVCLNGMVSVFPES